MKITETMLAAYVDGELTGAEHAAVEAAAKVDPAITARLHRHRQVRARLSGVFGSTLDEPAPDRLLATIASAKTGAGNVVDLAMARERRAAPAPAKRAGWLAWAAIAACLAIAAVIAQGQFASPAGPMIAIGPQGLSAKGALARALDRQLVADQQGSAQPVRILVSFRSTDGRLCRSFQIDRGPNLAGLACREADGWRLRATAASAPAATSEYRTAGSTTPTAILDTISATITGQPLDAAGESAARSKGWRP